MNEPYLPGARQGHYGRPQRGSAPQAYGAKGVSPIEASPLQRRRRAVRTFSQARLLTPFRPGDTLFETDRLKAQKASITFFDDDGPNIFSGLQVEHEPGPPCMVAGMAMAGGR